MTRSPHGTASTPTTVAQNTGTPPEAMQALTARNISFSYGDTAVLHSVSLDVKPGEIVGLLGPNGTGKSTLMGVLCGDLTPNEGSVHIYGKPIESYTRKELARARGVMPQSSEFPFAYTARDVVEMGRYPWDSSDEENDTIVTRSLEQADVIHLAHREVTQLSGGEAARVTFARVLAGQGRIIFLDEPTAALDISHQERTMILCTQLAREGVSVVALMHDIQLAGAYCDRIALMSQGRIAAFGEANDVLTSTTLSDVYSWPINVHTMPNGEIIILPQHTNEHSTPDIVGNNGSAHKENIYE